MSHKHLSLSGRQRGMASLIVVALLFFVLSLVAAYTNRNLIFEQRTSANQYRSTQALEAAEAGVEWALSMLNAGRIDETSCSPSADTSLTSFRNRYLTINATTGFVDPAPAMDADLAGTVWPSCVFNGSDWDCSCPATGSPSVTAPTGNAVYPAFRLRFVKHTPDRAGVVWLEVNGCTRLDDTCLDFPAQAVGGDSRSFLRVLIALKSALPAPPTAALTVRGDLDVAGTSLGAFNPSAGGSSLAILTGGGIDNDDDLRVGGAPGAPADPNLLILPGDPQLAMSSLPDDAARATRMFSNTLLATSASYREQPAAILMDCSGSCDASLIRDMAALNPGRILWAQGDVDLDDGGTAIGSATDPVMLVVDGAANIGVTVHGVVYGLPADWTLTGSGEVRGAVIAGNNLTSGAALTVVRDPAALSLLRWRSGSFVRVPGGWRDF